MEDHTSYFMRDSQSVEKSISKTRANPVPSARESILCNYFFPSNPHIMNTQVKVLPLAILRAQSSPKPKEILRSLQQSCQIGEISPKSSIKQLKEASPTLPKKPSRAIEKYVQKTFQHKLHSRHRKLNTVDMKATLTKKKIETLSSKPILLKHHRKSRIPLTAKSIQGLNFSNPAILESCKTQIISVIQKHHIDIEKLPEQNNFNLSSEDLLRKSLSTGQLELPDFHANGPQKNIQKQFSQEFGAARSQRVAELISKVDQKIGKPFYSEMFPILDIANPKMFNKRLSIKGRKNALREYAPHSCVLTPLEKQSRIKNYGRWYLPANSFGNRLKVS